jgi:pimeloyl-ACP methyl ester carboxylesterase
MKTVSRLIVHGFLFLMLSVMGAQADWPHIVPSKDGVPISYEIYGSSEPTLVFVHGWSCDARYWREQVPLFSKTHRVVVLDLAGHGHSGMGRTKYTMGSFGEDVKAVTEATGSQRVILLGHSMGGSVIVEAARLMPDRVMGLIGVDTLENVEFPFTREEVKKMMAPLEENFAAACRPFVSQMIYTNTDAQLREWILADMSAAPPAVAMSAMNEMMEQFITGEAAKAVEHVRAPIISVNGDLWPINFEANRRHMQSYDAIILKNADHFLMMNRPSEFNRALEQAIQRIVEKPAPAEKADEKK